MTSLYEYVIFPVCIATTVAVLCYFGRDCQRSSDQRVMETYKACIASNPASLCERIR
jgi:hypothetical protein